MDSSGAGGEIRRSGAFWARSSLRVLGITAAAMVLAEMASMGIVRLLGPLPFLAATIIDSFLMITLGFPILYVFSFRPLMLLAESRDRALREPEASGADLEAAGNARNMFDAAESSLSWSLAVTAASMVFAEIVAMMIIRLLGPLPYLATTLIDALLMIALGFPVLYALSFRPLLRLAESRARAQQELQAANAKLQAANRAERDARAAAEAIRSAVVAMTRTLDLETVLGALLEHLGRLVPFDRARVMLREDKSLLRVRAVVRDGGQAEFLRDAPTFQAGGDPVLRELLAGGKVVVIPDTHSHAVWGPRMLPEFEHSWLGVPLVSGGHSIGFYSISRKEAGYFREEHVRLAEALSAPASIAIQNATLFEEVRARRKGLKTLARKLVDMQESERRAVSRELHDEAGQALTSLKIGLRLLERTSGEAAIVSSTARLQGIVDGVQKGLHRLAVNLRPPSLDHVGLVAALGQLVESLSGSSGVHIEFATLGLDGGRLPSRMETDFYRIAQEAVTNAVRHSGAKQVDIVLERRDGRLRLLVEDDGCGFDPVVAERGGRLGLLGMRERAETLGGTLLVESGAGSGTTVVADAPDGR